MNCRDIYNADEFGLFYKALPDKSLHLKSEKYRRQAQVRLTGLAAANAEGDKLPMFVIGKSAKPRYFTGVLNLPCRFRTQRKCWMDSTLFEEWVRERAPQFERQGREIALIVDNCSAHLKIHNLKTINLVFLPPNSTSKTQPMDQGVIRSTKAYYRAACTRNYLDAIENGQQQPSLSVLDAMGLLTEAWSKVSKETVQNYFKKAGYGRQAQQDALNEDDDPFNVLSEELNALRERNPDLALEEVSAEDVVITDADVLTSDIDSLSDGEMLAEFREESNMEEDEENEEGNEEECPKRPTSSEIRQALDTLCRYSGREWNSPSK